MDGRRIPLMILAGIVLAPVAVLAASGLGIMIAGDKKILTATGIPDHDNGPFPSHWNPNIVTEQDWRFVVPAKPEYAARTTRLPQLGPIGIAVNGVALFNPYNRDGDDAVSGSRRERFDDCRGHPTEFGAYHYHQYSRCVIEEKPGRHSGIFGWSLDGFPVHGPQGVGGAAPTDLDECNGHVHPGEDKDRYHYHVTAKFPYIIGCYRGVIDAASFPRPGRRGILGGGGPRIGPPPR